MVTCLSKEELEYLIQLAHSLEPVLRLRLMCHMDIASYKDLSAKYLKAFGVSKHTDMDENVIYCLDGENGVEDLSVLFKSDSHLAVHATWIVAGTTNQLQSLRDKNTPNINQRIYFWNQDVGILVERYFIKNQSIENIIARTSLNGSSMSWESKRTFYNRRSDFRGSEIKVMGSTVSAPFVSYSQSEVKRIKWYKDRNGGDIASVTHLTGVGSFVEAMDMLASDMNMSSTKYLRRDNFRGSPIIKNRTVAGYTGMVGNLASGEVDIVINPIMHIIQRYGFVDFLHGLATLTPGLMVGSDAGNEDSAWFTYFQPFDNRLWLFLFVNVTLALVAVRLIQFLHLNGPVKMGTFAYILGWISDFTAVFFSFFGKPSDFGVWWAIASPKVMLFFVFLSGNIVFMAYKAGLAAELAVRRQLLPFHTPEGMYQADYK